MVLVLGKKQKETFPPEHEGTTLCSLINFLHTTWIILVDAWRRKQQITFNTLLSQTPLTIVLFFSLIGSLILSQQLLHSLVLALFLVLYTNADRDIGCVLTQDSTLSSFRSAQPTSRVSKAKLMRSDSYKAREWCCSFTLESFNMVPSTECSNTFNNDLRWMNFCVFFSLTKCLKCMTKAIDDINLIRLAYDVPLS